MNIIELHPRLVEKNARLLESGSTAESVSNDEMAVLLRGKVCHGYNKVYANVVHGTDTSIRLSFELSIPSVSAAVFDDYRKSLGTILPHGLEENIARAAGIGSPSSPEPSSHMASYAMHLFSTVVLGDEEVSHQNRAFDVHDCAVSGCSETLGTTRTLEVATLHVKGTFEGHSELQDREDILVYVPVTAIEFEDELTIPFAGYSDGALVESDGLKPFKSPDGLWEA